MPPVQPPRIMSFRLLMEYDGTRFQGWQGQGKARAFRTVSDVLAQAVAKAGLRLVELMGSGRTDSGVHALGQVAHLHVEGLDSVAPADLHHQLAGFLPPDLVVRAIAVCDPRFHARHHAIARTYLYQLALRPSALGHRFAWVIDRPLDPALLESAWQAFEGFSDLSAFAIVPRQKDPHVEVMRCETGRFGELVLLRITASHFLPRMVRRVVGACVRVAQGLTPIEHIRRDLLAPSREATLDWGRFSAPAQGLFLEHVQYPDEPGPGPLAPVIRVDP